MFVRRKSSHLVTSHEVPHYGSLPSVVADNQSAASDFTVVVNSEQLDLVGMPREAPLNGQGIMVSADDGAPLGIEKHGRSGRGRLKVPGDTRRRHGEVLYFSAATPGRPSGTDGTSSVPGEGGCGHGGADMLLWPRAGRNGLLAGNLQEGVCHILEQLRSPCSPRRDGGFFRGPRDNQKRGEEQA